MNLVLTAVAVLVVGAFLALRSARLGVVAAVTAGLMGLTASVRALLGGSIERWHVGWRVPYGAFAVELDALSAFFLALIFGLSALAAVYGDEYLAAWRGKKSLGAAWFFFNLLVASMAMVALARNGVLFLVAWELMALTSFFLVTFEDERDEVRAAGWTYLVASHLGTAFLLAMFVLLGRRNGSLDFNQFSVAPGGAGLLFVLALVGFGTKAGFMPLHVWLPEAHPAAPSHVSALMSGVMIKLGIYGLLRVLTFLGAPPAWFGWTLLAIGLASAVFGILFALAQHDLKRLLAYSSVENVGIIATGMGLGLLGVAHRQPGMAALGFGGALLHTLNHALFKGLLFLGTGAVAHGTGTRRLDQLGGVLRRMPVTGALFLLGAAAIAALPPLNGFAGEFLLYLAAYQAGTGSAGGLVMLGLAVIAALALVGGLVAATFAKAAGIVFLGEPRSEHVAHAHEPGWAMRGPMLVLAAGCVGVGLGAPWVLRALGPVIGSVGDGAGADMASAAGWLTAIVWAGVALMLVTVALVFLRRTLLTGRMVTVSETWGCGYTHPTARMQYTGSSFAQPLTELFAPLLRTRRHWLRETLTTETPDVASEGFFRPVFDGVEIALGRLRWLQHGRIQVYVLYIALTLLALLLWKLS